MRTLLDETAQSRRKADKAISEAIVVRRSNFDGSKPYEQQNFRSEKNMKGYEATKTVMGKILPESSLRQHNIAIS